MAWLSLADHDRHPLLLLVKLHDHGVIGLNLGLQCSSLLLECLLLSLERPNLAQETLNFGLPFVTDRLFGRQ